MLVWMLTTELTSLNSPASIREEKYLYCFSVALCPSMLKEKISPQYPSRDPNQILQPERNCFLSQRIELEGEILMELIIFPLSKHKQGLFCQRQIFSWTLTC